MTLFTKATRFLIATIAVAALALVVPAAPPANASGLVNCAVQNVMPGVAACYETVWANGVQVRMTFAHFNYSGAKPTAKTTPFYVVAPQTATLQGTVPFPHDHVVGNLPSQNHGDYSPLVHGFFVLCSAQGMASGGCVAVMTTIAPGTTVPLAKTANGQMLTSAGAIESAANAGLVVLIDTGATFVATINPSK